MNYKDILNERNKQYKKIEDLKKESFLDDKDLSINDKIKKEKFKYMFYNKLLKVKNENKTR